MGHTNSTANLSLPQFIGTDKPTWLGDVNGAFLAIDGYVGTNDAAVAAAASDASSAISQASAAVNTANTANTTAGNASTAANNAIGVANTANAIAGTVDAKVGLLADLNTTDRTSIVNAINEVNSIAVGTGASVTADGIKTYRTLLDELYALIDINKITAKTVLTLTKGTLDCSYYKISSINVTNAEFEAARCSNTSYIFSYVNVKASNSEFAVNINGTYTDNSTNSPTSGWIFTITY